MIFITKLFRAQNENFSVLAPEPSGAALFCLEPESAPGPRTSGAAHKKWRLRNTGFSTLLHNDPAAHQDQGDAPSLVKEPNIGPNFSANSIKIDALGL